MRQTYKRQIIYSTAGLFSIVFFILLTNPSSLSAPLLLLLPILVAVTTFITIKLFLKLFTNLPEIKITSLSCIIAVAPTLLIMLGSLGQLGLQDILLAVLLVAGISWYIKRIQGVAA